MKGILMKTKTIWIIVLVLLILTPLLAWGINRLKLEYQRHICAKNLMALGRVQTVYSNDLNDEYTVQNGQILNETFEGDKMPSKLYTFTMNDIDGNPVSLSQYQGKVILIVNVASKCGFTKQYAGLQALYEKYQEQGFVVLGFPANNFLGQEPGTNEEIAEFCELNFGVTFPMMSKISVKGKDIDPIYSWLTQKSENGKFDAEVSWNFQKFMINENGDLVDYSAPRESPLSEKIVNWIEN